MSLQEAVDNCYDAVGNRAAWRFISALTEEAGEVQGAFNKMMDGNKRKPKTENDVMEELIQLTANCFMTAKHYGFTVEEMLFYVDHFLGGKHKEFTDG